MRVEMGFSWVAGAKERRAFSWGYVWVCDGRTPELGKTPVLGGLSSYAMLFTVLGALLESL